MFLKLTPTSDATSKHSYENGKVYLRLPSEDETEELYKHLCFRSNPLYVYNARMLYIICIY